MPIVCAERLSKTYRPYPGEKIVFSNAERLHVKTRVLETSGLINRLMKYGDACRIISPPGQLSAQHYACDGPKAAADLGPAAHGVLSGQCGGLWPR